MQISSVSWQKRRTRSPCRRSPRQTAAKLRTPNQKTFESSYSVVGASLFSSSNDRLPRQNTKELKFWSLPGEIRNRIYQYVIPECRILVVQSKPNKEHARSRAHLHRHTSSQLIRGRTRLGYLVNNDQMTDGLTVSAVPLLVCKQFRDEMELYLYSRITFCFSSMKVLARFLKTASTSSIEAVKYIELSQTGYAQLNRLGDESYVTKYQRRWGQMCEQIGTKMVGLEGLRLQFHLQDWLSTPGQDTYTMWRRSCLALSSRRLSAIKIVLQTRRKSRRHVTLKYLASDLENDVMTTCAQRAKAERIEMQIAAQVQSDRVASEQEARAQREQVEAFNRPAIVKTITAAMVVSMSKESGKGKGKAKRLNSHCQEIHSG